MFPRPAAAILALLTLFTPATRAESPMRMLTCRDGKLYDGDQEFRFVSWNIPNLHNVEDAFEFFGETPWRWPDAFEIADALDSVQQMGGRVARTYVISVRRKDGDMGDNVHVTGPGEFNEAAFRTLDLVLKIAAEKRVRVIIPLVDNWHWWGGVRQYEAFRGKSKGDFWTDPQLLEDFKRTIHHVLNRRNTLTGVLYREDPTILGWETGNELDSPPEWTRRVSAYLKEIDPDHLVIDGNALNGVPVHSLDDPNVDVVTTHHYPNAGNNNAESVLEAMRLVGGKKAYFVGEFGFLPIEEAQRVLDTVIDEGVSGALYWSLRFHRREGGFYWHHEPSGEDLYKAYHWPGFPEGEEYREHLVIPMIRDAAFRIQGEATPPLPLPTPPNLLTPTSPRLLSWQGSAGASVYDVQRAAKPDGPWATIATDISDAAFQYRPLFADETAEPSVEHYYRVVAKNASGESEPSETIGPIIAPDRLLADEFQDDSRLASRSGETSFVSDQPRKTQEDIHRLAMTPGSTVTYRLNHAVTGVRVWLFTPGESTLTLQASADGESYTRLELTQQTTPGGANDYGYHRPYFLKVTDLPAKTRWIRLSLPAGADEVQLSRVEIRSVP
ncbi:hypothetical protein MalM25_17880 [Planctomycetes bacterium MalM25]|nr:hypothetical protein MalM25_17880 [Planctomycetes bacterium MalM25]